MSNYGVWLLSQNIGNLNCKRGLVLPAAVMLLHRFLFSFCLDAHSAFHICNHVLGSGASSMQAWSRSCSGVCLDTSPSWRTHPTRLSGVSMLPSSAPEWVHPQLNLPGECSLEQGRLRTRELSGLSINLWRWEGNPFTNMGTGAALWLANNKQWGFFFSWIPSTLLSVVLSNNLALVFLSEGFKWNDLNSCFVCTLSFKELQWRPRQTVD